MILQSATENCVHGKSPSDEKITLTVSGSSGVERVLSAVSNENGEYEIIIPPYPPSFESYTLTFSCGGEKIVFSDVLFGELYHISGQSNMELPIFRTIDPLDPKIPKGSRFIREFRVPVVCCFGKDEEYDDFQGGEWKYALGNDILNMSAAGYYFSEKLSEKLDVPIGLVNTSAGGSPVEARMPYGMLMELGGYEEFLARCTVQGYEKIRLRLTGQSTQNGVQSLKKRTVFRGIFLLLLPSLQNAVFLSISEMTPCFQISAVGYGSEKTL